ncbi:hypothetical protein PFFCH_02792 [Plasmodium falciparum FCH/4]|uniref:Uncharacterized protein n=1 Tax=Plasmodium falciparum FCH/4 TaxID=1036724 RepID=A0A024VMR4_PLAFA|nr:hypothetical protein PFFCH_02792 [Plasmodium falciparum FCH/4]
MNYYPNVQRKLIHMNNKYIRNNKSRFNNGNIIYGKNMNYPFQQNFRNGTSYITSSNNDISTRNIFSNIPNYITNKNNIHNVNADVNVTMNPFNNSTPVHIPSNPPFAPMPKNIYNPSK